MIELGGEPNFAAKLVQRFLGNQARVWNLQRNTNALDRVQRSINDREAAFGQTALDAVLAEKLPSSKHGVNLREKGLRERGGSRRVV